MSTTPPNHSLQGLGAEADKLNPPSMSCSEAPIERIPVELLAMIFLRCLPGQPNPDSDDDHPDEVCRKLLYASMVPQRLSSVCTTWRSLALDIPGLWANLHVNAWYPTLNREMAIEWIHRAKIHPLSLHLGLQEKAKDAEALWMFDDLLLAYMDRWCHLDLRMDYADALLPMVSYLEEDSPSPTAFNSLESLHLALKYVGGEDLLHAVDYIIPEAPRLRHFTLESWSDSLGSGLDILAHETLTHIDLPLISCPSSIAFCLLENCPSLSFVNLQIDSSCSGDDEDDYEDWPLVTAQSLTTLVLGVEFERDFVHFCSKLCLPSLTNLDLYCPPHMITLKPFLAFLTRSSCTLRSFGLKMTWKTKPKSPCSHLIKFLGHKSVAKSLEVLSFGDSAADWGCTYNLVKDGFLDFLIRSEPNNLLPRLREIRLSTDVERMEDIEPTTKKISGALLKRHMLSAASTEIATLERAKLRFRIRCWEDLTGCRNSEVMVAGLWMEFELTEGGELLIVPR